jgi:HlyD family secretion protein
MDAVLRAPVRRRRMFLLVGACVTAATTGTGLFAGRVVRSPQQLLAEGAGPGSTVLTATVEWRVLTDNVVLRGLVGAQARVETTPAPTEAVKAVVSGVRVRPGQQVAPGAALIEVSGRPVIALLGAVPAYRDLRPGSEGADVKQAQAALRSLGLDPGESAGTFGDGTKRAVEELYRRLGYAARTTGDAGLRQVSDAAEQVRQRERVLVQARETLDRLRRGEPASAAAAVSPAASASASPGASPAASPGPSGAPVASSDPIADAERQVRFAEEDLAAARAALADLERTTGTMLPMSEVVFLPAFPARVEAVGAGVGGEVKAPLLTLSSGRLVVRGGLNPADRALVKPGLPVQIVAELLGVTVPGRVESVGEVEKDASGTFRHPVTVLPDGDPLPERLNGADVRLSVVAASTGDPVLVVPASAVFADATGQTGVLRVGPDGRQERVVVTVGASGDGYVAVVPVRGGLAEGDAVAVGTAGR